MGIIRTTETIVVNGRFEGELDCKSLIIGLDGYFVGHAEAENVDISGHFIGELVASKIKLSSSAHVEGKFRYYALTTDKDSIFVGEFKKIQKIERSNAFNLLLETEIEHNNQLDKELSY